MPEVVEPGESMARSCRQPENSKAKHQQSLTHVTNAAPLAAKHYAILGSFPKSTRSGQIAEKSGNHPRETFGSNGLG
jgi:hypothetical protein